MVKINHVKAEITQTEPTYSWKDRPDHEENAYKHEYCNDVRIFQNHPIFNDSSE